MYSFWNHWVIFRTCSDLFAMSFTPPTSVLWFLTEFRSTKLLHLKFWQSCLAYTLSVGAGILPIAVNILSQHSHNVKMKINHWPNMLYSPIESFRIFYCSMMDNKTKMRGFLQQIYEREIWKLNVKHWQVKKVFFYFVIPTRTDTNYNIEEIEHLKQKMILYAFHFLSIRILLFFV